MPIPGVRANLKFINPVKVPCTVNFSIKPRGQWPAGVPFPMEVMPSQLVIPPHEYRYTTVYFAPNAIQQYAAVFEAVVEGGSDPKTKAFTCDVKGEGTLPSLTLQEPSAFDPQGRPLLKFGRQLLGKANQLRISLRNNGTLPASARLEMDPSPAFTLVEGPQMFSVDSKQGASFAVEFNPPAAQQWNHELRLRVQQNPFEDYRIALTGEGYQEDVTYDRLTGSSTDELRLPDTPVNTTRTEVIAVCNHSSTKMFRFRWPTGVPNLTFMPSMGHLLPGQTKDITVTFKAAVPVKLAPQEVKLSLGQIQYKDAGQEPVDWDDTPRVLDFGEPPPEPSTSGRGSPGPKGQAPPQAAPAPSGPQARAEPEPAVVDVPSTSKDLALKVFAVADNAKYECDLRPIAFRPTMMFQTRSFAFPLRNTSSAKLDFKFVVLSADGDCVDSSGLYSVSPEGGTVEPGESASITVRFSPTEVEDCSRLLRCEMPNLDESMPRWERQLNGKVLRPWCHFDLPESDYVSAGRRNAEMPGPSGVVEPLDTSTKVLEFDSLGVRVRNTKRFMVLNPTSVAYEFFWDRVTGSKAAAASQESSSPFTCITRKGVIGGGRQFEMVFEYTPATDSITESFWIFRIPEQNIEVPFLLVGQVAEPRVRFDRPALSFGQCLISGAKGRATVRLYNDEDMPFQWSLDRATYDATDELVASLGRPPSVQFEPSSGTVPARGHVELQATFSPYSEGQVNYNVVCNVRKKPTRLTLNVKGEGYALHAALQLENPDGSVVNLAAGSANNHIDFGQVIVNERAVKQLVLVNGGQLDYHYSWEVGTNPRINIKPESGKVARGERVLCELSYTPHGPDKLRSYPVSCSIVNGGKYTLLLDGVGHKPRLDLSWYQHDFGAVAVFEAGMEPMRKTLVLRNNDQQPISVDPQWTNTDEWDLEFPACVLQPSESKEATVTFRPSAAQPYAASIPLEINGLYSLRVDVKGEGAPLKVEVANPAQRTVNFGSVQRGQSTTRVVQVINRGRVPATINFGPAREVLAKCAVEVLPSGEVYLRPRETADLSFFFRPQARMRSFSEDLAVSVNGVSQSLLTLAGACLGIELKLASESLPFGPVVLGSRSVKRIALENTGDVGTKFTWDARALGEHFTVHPAEGYINPHQDAKIDVTFEPKAVNADVRVERVRLRVEGGEDRFLTLTGACINTSPQAEVVNLSCAVRGQASTSISLHNTSSSAWSLRPVFQNDFFSGPELVTVAPGQKVTYPVTFKPLSMSSPDKPHDGSVFFPIPDGTGLLYRLVGKAESPVPQGKIERTIPSKQAHTEVLRVNNWLHRPQRFKVIIARQSADPSTQLEGPEYVDVPALSFKDFKLNVYSFTASTTTATVTFKNEASGEYLFYELKLTASAPEKRGSLSLECPIRTTTSSKVQIRNPTGADVTAKCSVLGSKQVGVPATVVLRANALTAVELQFRPLMTGSSTATLKVESAELGLFEWELGLVGLPTNPEKTLTFNVPLGGRETQTVRFMHYLDEKADYKVSLRGPADGSAPAAPAAPLSPTPAAGAKPGSAVKKGAAAAAASAVAPVGPFEVQASISAPPGGANGIEVQLEVHFEPSTVGEAMRDMLVISSPTAGEYQFPLVGRCVPPKPQGPVECGGKSAGSVPFKNVFTKEADFLFSVDNPCFAVKPNEKIAAKKPTAIAVTYKPDPSKPTVRTGKLTVSCPSMTQAQWVYYLQATEEAGGGAAAPAGAKGKK